MAHFIADPLQSWLKTGGIEPMSILPGSTSEHSYNERFKGTLRREVFDAEWFATARQAQVEITIWLKQYNEIPTQETRHAPAGAEGKSRESARKWPNQSRRYMLR